MLKQFERELLSEDWRAIREGLEVKLCPSPDGEETFVLCRSRDRREKEKAMHGRFERRIEEGLQRIAAAFLWRRSLCGLARSSSRISAFCPFSAPHNLCATLWGECSVFPFSPEVRLCSINCMNVPLQSRVIAKAPCWKSGLPS
jgi:hypothetical protein